MPRFNSRSIRFRLTAWYAAILAATFLTAAALVSLTLAYSIRSTVDNELRAHLATVRRYVAEEAAGPGATHLSEELNEDAIVNSGSAYLRIFASNGSLLYGSPNARDWPAHLHGDQGLPPSGIFTTIHVHGRSLRLLTAPVAVGAAEMAFPLDEFQQLQRDFFITTAFGLPTLLVIAALAGYWLSARALRPVDRISHAAEHITSANLSERLPSTGAHDELDRLSAVLNLMLDRLESAFRRITQFTADASHELRTPLAIIRTTSELMHTRPRTGAEHEQAWSSVLAQTERTTQLIDDLLTLTRADSAAADIFQFNACDLAAAASATVSEMQVLASAKGIAISFSAAALPLLRADEEALRRVIAILIDNALKATSAGGSIAVSLSFENATPSTVVLTVQDSGTGISPEHVPHIFDRFYRASPDRSRATGGAGLGLAIAHWIVTRHGGAIEVESQLGRGSLFRVHLPAPGSTTPLFTDSSEPEVTLRK